ATSPICSAMTSSFVGSHRSCPDAGSASMGIRDRLKRRVKTYQLYINGEFVDADSSTTLDVIDPSTAELLARVPDAGQTDVDRAVKAARAAFDEGPWKDSTAQDRGRILLDLARVIRQRAEELAELETRNSGKPIVEAEF